MARPCLERCPECPSRKLPEDKRKIPVAWDGPEDAEVVFVGEAPGSEENNRHRPFVGKAGEEFNLTYLPRAGMGRDGVYITNTVKCHWADSSDAPPETVIRSCSQFHLSRELQRVNPRIVVLMGGVANSLMGWDVDLEHGIMHPDQDLLGWHGDIYSTFHPALGLHMGNKMQALLDDFRALQDYLRGRISPLESACPVPVYERLRTKGDVDDAFGLPYTDDTRIAVDTESIKRWRGFRSTIRYTPDRLTFCVEPPYAFMVMGSDEQAVGSFNRHLRRFRRIYLHNRPHDEWALLQMGVEVPCAPVYDTMSGAYHDGRLPKGLKALGYRLAGIRMTSFDEVVIPYGYELAIDYLDKARSFSWEKPEQTATGEKAWRNCPTCKGKAWYSIGRGKSRREYECECGIGKAEVPVMTRNQSLNQAIDRVFTDLKSSEVKVWDRWDAWTKKEHLLPAIHEMIRTIGAIPVPSIDYVPEGPAMTYACGDALVTRIIGPMVESRVAKIRRMVR